MAGGQAQRRLQRRDADSCEEYTPTVAEAPDAAPLGVTLLSREMGDDVDPVHRVLPTQASTNQPTIRQHLVFGPKIISGATDPRGGILPVDFRTPGS